MSKFVAGDDICVENAGKFAIDHSDEITLIEEDPVTCGKCGARTEFIELDLSDQIHTCMNTSCGHVFVASA